MVGRSTLPKVDVGEMAADTLLNKDLIRIGRKILADQQKSL